MSWRPPVPRLVCGFLLLVVASRLSASEIGARRLIIALDAVPFALLEELTDPSRGEGALFEGFSRPLPFISTFPSTTSVALAGMLASRGLERSPGYEARFFDWERREVRGGGAISYFRIEFPWRDFFDWSGKGVARSAVSSLRPVSASMGRLERAVDAFLHSEQPNFFVYIETTDVAAHLRGPDSLVPVFETLDGLLKRLRNDHPQLPFSVVLFSDHGIAGGEPLVNVWPAVREALEAGGYRTRRKLEKPGDVALTPYGLVSSFEAYVDPAERAAAAAVIASVDGVELCTHPEYGGWRVVGAAGDAGIRHQVHGDLWAYEPRGADPLDYGPVGAGLARRHESTVQDGFPDRWWLEATRDHRFPDALYRIARAFDGVENPASLVCSVAEGHMFGLRRTELGARFTGGQLRWTHGALFSEASLGFLMTDQEGWLPQEALRFSEGLLPFLGPPDGEAVAATGQP